MTAHFSGRLFGPALPGTGMAASGRWEGDMLRVAAGAVELAAPAAELRIDGAGFNAERVRVSWQSADGAYALFLEQPSERVAFNAGAPAPVALQLAAAGRKGRCTEARLRLGWALLGLFLLLPFLALAAFLWQADTVATWVAERVPPEQEARIGELTLAQVRTRMHLIETGPAAEAVRTVGARLTAGSRYRYRWYVADRPEVNAFAAPGGVVVVFAGLIRAADTPEELAGVLAHETAHVELRHSLKGAIKGLGLRALLALALGDLANTVAGDLAADLTEMKFSRDAEAEADQEGLQRLVAAGISPHGMPAFFDKLAKAEGGAAPALSILSTHPASAERMETLRREIAALPARSFEPLALDWVAVRESLVK
ncbi:MAG: M48 family metallopeptidase [Pseudomonadota bacterium]|jgi:Zn-dependent protease with chaperone function